MDWDIARGDHRFYIDIQTYCSSFVGPVRSETHQSLSTVLWNKCFILRLDLTEICFAKLHITWKKNVNLNPDSKSSVRSICRKYNQVIITCPRLSSSLTKLLLLKCMIFKINRGKTKNKAVQKLNEIG